MLWANRVHKSGTMVLPLQRKETASGKSKLSKNEQQTPKYNGAAVMNDERRTLA